MPPCRVISAWLPETFGSTVTIGCAWLRTEALAEQLVVAVGGQLDVSGSDASVDALLSVVEANEPHSLTLDLSELTFIDASGIRAFVQIDDDARAHGCELLLTHPRPMISRVFEICGLSHHLGDR